MGLAVVLRGMLLLAARQTGRPEQSVRGAIVNLGVHSIARADSVDVRVDGGEFVRSSVAESVNISPGHLRAHMLLAEPVTVTYQPRAGSKLASRFED